MFKLFKEKINKVCPTFFSCKIEYDDGSFEYRQVDDTVSLVNLKFFLSELESTRLSCIRNPRETFQKEIVFSEASSRVRYATSMKFKSSMVKEKKVTTTDYTAAEIKEIFESKKVELINKYEDIIQSSYTYLFSLNNDNVYNKIRQVDSYNLSMHLAGVFFKDTVDSLGDSDNVTDIIAKEHKLFLKKIKKELRLKVNKLEEEELEFCGKKTEAVETKVYKFIDFKVNDIVFSDENGDSYNITVQKISDLIKDF